MGTYSIDFWRKLMKKYLKALLPMVGIVTIVVATDSANGATITEDFQSSSLGSTTPPAGWSLVSVSGPSAYETTVGNGGAGLGGQISGNHPQNASTIPAGYVVNSGGVAFDTTKPISGSFDFFIPEAGNYSSAMFMVGDIQTGISGTAAGEWLGMFLRERTFGARAQVIAGDESVLFDGNGDNQYRIDTNQWIEAAFTWTPTAGTTGDFSFEWTYPAQPNRGPMTVTGYTFDSEQAFFGFGTGGYFGGTHQGVFDNINITGTEFSDAVVPEPAAIAIWSLLGLGLAGQVRRRRKTRK
jgi:MYXO-CTERM domain-containing protein